MSILVNKDSRVIIQGITGSEGTFHGQQMFDYGTNIVAGVTPGKGGMKALNDAVDVYNSVKDVGFVRFSSKDVFRHTLVQKIIEAYERFKGKWKVL